MSLELDATGRRIVGTLIEKQCTTPNVYPLTVNAITVGCSQKSNREPVRDFQSFEIEGALRDLYVEGWATNVQQAGSRGLKWKHRATEKLDVEGAALAVMAELLLRGPQAPGELRTRASRMETIGDLSELETVLGELETKGLVTRLPRRPGERAARVDHTLYPAGENPEFAAQDTVSSPVVSPPRAESTGRQAADLEQRVELLEDAVRELRERLSRLEG
ncbi:MAG: DUF480 domain-containing protein [Planctomycetota bacterium]